MSPPLACAPNDLISDVATMISDNKMHCILVYDEEKRFLGIITSKDVAFRGAQHRNLRAIDIATKDPIVVRADMLVIDALEIMVKSSIRHLPIRRNTGEEIMGIIDITRCFHQAMLKWEQLARNYEKLNDVFKDFMEDNTTQERNLILQSISRLISLMEAPTLKTILDSSTYNTIPLILNPSNTVSDALNLMKRHNSSAVLIRDESPATAIATGNSETAHISVERNHVAKDFNIIGIFTSKDVVYRVLSSSQRVNIDTCSLARVMTTKPNCASMNLGLHSALRMMYEGHFLNLPVVDNNGTILGLISVLQLTHAALSHQLSRSGKKNKLDDQFVHILKNQRDFTLSATPNSSKAHRTNSWTNLSTMESHKNFSQREKFSELEDQSQNYFWSFFDTSDNEGSISASSSQLSLVDANISSSKYFSQKGLLSGSIPKLARVVSSHEDFKKKFNHNQGPETSRNIFTVGSQKELETLTRSSRFRIYLVTHSTVANKTNLPKYKIFKLKGPNLENSTSESFSDKFFENLAEALGIDFENLTYNVALADGTQRALEGSFQLKELSESYLKVNGMDRTVPLTVELIDYHEKSKAGMTMFRYIIEFMKKYYKKAWARIGLSFLLGVQFGRLFK